MDSQARAQRHCQLWEAGSARVRRIAVGGLIFAVLILLKVVAPYEERRELQEALQDRQAEVEAFASDLTSVRAVEQTLEQIEGVIREQPWSEAKEALQEFFRQGLAGDAQTRADQTVREIAGQIRSAIVGPLRAATQQSGSNSELARLPEFVEAEITDWETDILGKKWYLTLGSKEKAVKEVEIMLQELRQQAVEIIQRTKTEISNRTEELETQSRKAEKDIAQITKTIDEGMDQALPAWAGKLISAPSLVFLYPWILIGIALYFVGSALSTSRHYHGMADENGWTADERRDPLFSSVWTLTSRGPIGTATTILTYSAVLAGLWYCLYLSHQYAQLESITMLLEQDSDKQGFPIWLGHALMALALGLTFAWVGRGSRRA